MRVRRDGGGGISLLRRIPQTDYRAGGGRPRRVAMTASRATRRLRTDKSFRARRAAIETAVDDCRRRRGTVGRFGRERKGKERIGREKWKKKPKKTSTYIRKLYLLSTGIIVLAFGRWFLRKFGDGRRRSRRVRIIFPFGAVIYRKSPA